MNLFNESFLIDALKHPLPSSGIVFSSIQTDSRKVAEGSLFFCLKGETLDGHDYIEKALAQGAAGIVCEERFTVTNGAKLTTRFPHAKFYSVKDTLFAYRKLARAWRATFDIPFFVVAGSVGKTTTKEWLTTLLKGHYSNVLKTEGSQNGFIGIPMTLLELRPGMEAAVIEVGIDEPGAMAQHLELVKPKYSVITALGPEHLEKLGDVETAMWEERLCLEWTLNHEGLIAINLDETYLAEWAKTLSAPNRAKQVIGFSMRKETLNAKYPFPIFIGQANEKERQLEVEGPVPLTVPLPLPGIHHARNTLAALATCFIGGLDLTKISPNLDEFNPVFGRTQMHDLTNGIRIIGDYYNANPTSMEAAIDLLDRDDPKYSGLRYAVLGDMRELGTEERRYHQELAGHIAHSRIDAVFLYGKSISEFTAPKLEELGFKSFQTFQDKAELATALKQVLKPNDRVLIKASRSLKFEEIYHLMIN